MLAVIVMAIGPSDEVSNRILTMLGLSANEIPPTADIF
jgi:hypothetical protein